MTASNNDVLNALANVIECRSHRRGRKPQWNIIIFTDEKGTVRIVDLITECKAIVGKRACKKRKEETPADEGVKERIRRKFVEQHQNALVDSIATLGKRKKAVVTVDVKDVPSDVRISPRTGKPVRAYKKKSDTIKELEQKVDAVLTNSDAVQKENIDSLKQLLASAKVGLTGAETTGNKRLIDLFAKNIEDIKTRLGLLGVTV